MNSQKNLPKKETPPKNLAEELKFVEVKLSEKEHAVNLYRFVLADLVEGLNYNVSKDAYNTAMKAIGSDKRTLDIVTAEKFCDDFYREFTLGDQK